MQLFFFLIENGKEWGIKEMKPHSPYIMNVPNLTKTYRKSSLLSWRPTRRCRSSRPELFCKKAVLKNFAEFSAKRLCWRLLLINL